MPVITDKMRLLEQLHGQPIRVVIVETLRKRHGASWPYKNAAADLGVTEHTLRAWCWRLGLEEK